MSDSICDLTVSDGSTPEILRLNPDWASQPESDFDFGREVIQHDAGATALRFLTSDIGWKTACTFTNASKADEYALLDFFCRHKGRANRFWLPVQWQYFQLANAVSNGQSYFQLAADSFVGISRGYERLIMLLNSGDLLTRQILGYEEGAYGIASAFDRNIDPGDIALFGRLILCRFDVDEIEMEHETAEVSTCRLSFKELAKEY